jgi:hypothetical protein
MIRRQVAGRSAIGPKVLPCTPARLPRQRYEVHRAWTAEASAFATIATGASQAAASYSVLDNVGVTGVDVSTPEQAPLPNIVTIDRESEVADLTVGPLASDSQTVQMTAAEYPGVTFECLGQIDIQSGVFVFEADVGQHGGVASGAVRIAARRIL